MAIDFGWPGLLGNFTPRLRIGRFTAALLFVMLNADGLSSELSMVKIGEYPFQINGCGGISYSGRGGLFYVVKDHAGRTGWQGFSSIYPVDLDIDIKTGAVVSQKISEPFTPGKNRDSEDIAVDFDSGTFWLADEFVTPSITEFDMTGKPSGRIAPIPEIQKKYHRDNQSIESLTIAPCSTVMWTANEQALTCDGEAAFGNSNVATMVRLIKFIRKSPGHNWAYAGSWAYQCDPCADPVFSQSGLSGMCALPDGSLLMLEREISISTCGRCRIYRLTSEAICAATELTSITSLTNATFRSVSKGLPLIDFRGERLDVMKVYEGITLGPKLADGKQAVYLIADGGEKRSKMVLGFKITAETVGSICALKLTGLEKAISPKRKKLQQQGRKNEE